MKPPASLALPLGVYFLGFVLLPLGLIALISLRDPHGVAWVGLANYGRFVSDAYNRGVLWATLDLGLRTTLLDAVLAFPIAQAALAWPRLRRLILGAVLLPMLTSTVVRSFAWVIVLGNRGLINNALLGLGLADAPLHLLYTPWAVAVALAQIELPLMVLPLMTALANIEANLAEASYVLGAGRWRTLRRIILPLSMPGLLTGGLLVFTGAVSALVTQTLIGGGQLPFMPFYIYEQAIQAQDWGFSAALAVVLLVTIVAIAAVLNIAGRRSGGYRHG